MQDKDVLQEFMNAGALLQGHFVLSSGLHSERYLQCARVLMDPKRASRLCFELSERVRGYLRGVRQSIDLVASPAMGGVIVGYEMARQLDVPSIFFERENGKLILRRGFTIEPGTRVLMVEDIVTTGLSSRECIAGIAEHDGVTVLAACLIDRSNGQADVGVPLISLAQLEIPTFPPDNLPYHLAAIPVTKPGSRGLK